MQEKNTVQGKPPVTRTDMRVDVGPQGKIFLLNKGGGVIRMIVP
jgi:hypothetical protein